MSEARPEETLAATPAPAPVEMPAATAAPETPPAVETPAIETPPPEAPAAAETPAPVYDPSEGTLRATESPKTEGEEKKPEEAAKVEEPPAAVEEIKYEFQLPEGMEIPEERAAPLTEWLGKHKVPAEDAQALMDMHTSAMKAYADHLVAEQWRVFAEMNANKRAEIMADRTLGGAGYETSKRAAQAMIDLLIPDPEDRVAFNRRMEAGGMLDDIEFLRMMVNAARRFGEPAPPPPNPAPVANGAGKPPRGTAGGMYTYPRGNSGA